MRRATGEAERRVRDAERAVEEIKAQAEEWVAQTRQEFLEARSKVAAEVESARSQLAELETLRAERAELEQRLRDAEATVERLQAETEARAAEPRRAGVEAPPAPGTQPSAPEESAGPERRDRAWIWAQVRRLAAEGHSQREIARRLEINRRTVARLVAADEPPRYRRAHRGSILDPLEPVMRSVLADSPRIDATAMTEVLREHGYRGSVDLVRRRLHAMREP